MKKHLVTIGSVIIILFNNASPLYAIEDNVTTDLEGTNLIECIRQGKLDFISFINASVSNENFVELFTESWDDLFLRNSCHALTVLSLLEERNAIRDTIRDASLSCGKTNTESMQNRYKDKQNESEVKANKLDK